MKLDKKYSKLGKSDLLSIIKDLKETKKYGLVWDEDKTTEIFENDPEKNIAIPMTVDNFGIKDGSEKPINILMEGDNYHSLSILNYTHKGKIDCIYIDPPYNTGAKDWKYNNHFVDAEDPYRHSKWLAMMAKRLRLARTLLKPDGIICVTIDDYEMPRLWILLEEIFDDFNHLGTVTIRNYPSGRKTKRKLAQIHEYALFFGRTQKASIKNLEVDIDKKTHSYVKDKDGSWHSPTNLRKQGIDSNADKKDGTLKDRYFPIYYDPVSGKVSTKKKLKVKVLPIDPNGEKRIWRRSKEDVDKMYEEGEIWGKDTKKNGLQIYFKFRGGIDGEPPKSMWYDPKFSASEHGTKVLRDILGEREKFEYPKSIHAVMECIKIMTQNDNAIVLDFFAGSGTTGQAVLELNKLDGKNRSFIICTNNENDICTEVTLPRIKNVINGYNFKGEEKVTIYKNKLTVSKLNRFSDIIDEMAKVTESKVKLYDKIETKLKDNTIFIIGIKKHNGKKKGLGGHLKYYKTDFINVDNVGSISDKRKIDLTYQAGELIALKEGAYYELEKNNNWQIFKGADNIVGIYFSEDQSDLEKIFKKFNGEAGILYIFSWGKNSFNGSDYGHPNIFIKDIPQPIIEVYKEINKLRK